MTAAISTVLRLRPAGSLMTSRDRVLLIGLILVLGCGESGETKYVVRGTVTYQGNALERGTINFFPKKGKPFGGPLQRDGSFEFRLPAGDYDVAVRSNSEPAEGWKEDGAPPTGFKSLLPPVYSRPDTSGLSAKIIAQDEPTVCNFEL